MTTTIAENVNRDFYLGADGNVAFISAAPCIAQLTKSRMESQRGEMMYSMNTGMPTRQTAWDTFNPKAFESAARTIITATPDVVRVNSFSIQNQAGQLTYETEIATIYGNVMVTQ